MFNRNEEDLLDEIPEGIEDEIDDDFDQADEEEEVPEKKEEELKIPKVRDDSELLELRQRLEVREKELDDAKKEAELHRTERHRADQFAIRTHVEKLESNDKMLRSQIRIAEVELEEAKHNGDTEKARRLRNEIDDRNDEREKLRTEVSKYTPLINNNPVASQPAETKREVEDRPKQPSMEEIRAADWIQANSTWYNDPSHYEKRARANELFEDLKARKYDPSSAVFWKHIDKELGIIDQPVKKRSAPVVRGTVQNTDKPSQRKKDDSEILEHTNRILKNMGFSSRDKEDPEFKRRSAAVYKSVKKNLPKYKKG